MRQIQEFKALDDQHRRKLTRYKLESNQKFEKIKDKVFEIKQKQSKDIKTEEPTANKATDENRPNPPQDKPTEAKPGNSEKPEPPKAAVNPAASSNDFVINTNRIKQLKNKKFGKKNTTSQM
jgi:hypothetical protein